MESGDWRSQLTDISRNRIVNKITDILKIYIPISGPEAEAEGLQELRKIALKFEQKIYTSPTTANQNDYLRKIALKMKVMETISQNPMPDAMHANPGANSVNPGMDHNFGLAVDGAQCPNLYKRDPHFEIVGSMTRARTKIMNDALNAGANI